ncbi:hypothetical protein ACFWDQ_13310 [Streptomyces sp. NPDC060053]
MAESGYAVKALPDGYPAPFFKADREAETREAHAYFSARLRKGRPR